MFGSTNAGPSTRRSRAAPSPPPGPSIQNPPRYGQNSLAGGGRSSQAPSSTATARPPQSSRQQNMPANQINELSDEQREEIREAVCVPIPGIAEGASSNIAL